MDDGRRNFCHLSSVLCILSSVIEMAIEAPISKFKKTNIKIYIACCIALIIWCVYDAHFNEEFKKKYTDSNDKPTGWLVVNRKAPPYLIGAAVLLGAYLFTMKNKKLVADENVLIIPRSPLFFLRMTGNGGRHGGDEKIPYDSIEKIDRTYFDSKGYFVITYKNNDGVKVKRKLNARRYDNLEAILEHLVAKIS